MRLAAALAGIALALPLLAHEPFGAAAVGRYLQDAERWRDAAANGTRPELRAEAYYRLGVLLEEVCERLNADAAAHGGVRGLRSAHLAAELTRLGLPLEETNGRFAPDGRFFEAALDLAPGASIAADAGLRLLRSRFYRSYESDPLDWRVDHAGLAAQLALAEALIARFPAHPGLEEIEFIAAVLYTRAARLPDSEARKYAAKAREASAAFATRYPDSLRSAAMPVLRDALPPQ